MNIKINKKDLISKQSSMYASVFGDDFRYRPVNTIPQQNVVSFLVEK